MTIILTEGKKKTKKEELHKYYLHTVDIKSQGGAIIKMAKNIKLPVSIFHLHAATVKLCHSCSNGRANTSNDSRHAMEIVDSTRVLEVEPLTETGLGCVCVCV